MKIKAKVQKNDNDVNVLVETQSSSNRHYSHLNKAIHVVKILSDEEILELWKLRNAADELKFAKEWIKKQDNYAVSDCHDEVLEINYNSIIEYEFIEGRIREFLS